MPHKVVSSWHEGTSAPLLDLQTNAHGRRTQRGEGVAGHSDSSPSLSMAHRVPSILPRMCGSRGQIPLDCFITQRVEACCCFHATIRSLAMLRSWSTSLDESISRQNFSISNFWPRVKAIGSIHCFEMTKSTYCCWLDQASCKGSCCYGFEVSVLKRIHFAGYRTLPVVSDVRDS